MRSSTAKNQGIRTQDSGHATLIGRVNKSTPAPGQLSDHVISHSTHGGHDLSRINVFGTNSAPHTPIQRKESANISVPSISSAAEQTLQSPGQAMDKSTRSFMEQRFGFDFGNVRIHNDTLAHRSSGEINALAYTNKNHVVFGAGHYRPETESGRRLLAHELTHVVQQRGMNQLGIQRLFNFTKPTPQKTINPVTIKYNQDKGRGNRSLGLTTNIVNNNRNANVGQLAALLQFGLQGLEQPPGTFSCQAVSSGNVAVTAEELVLTANSRNKWTGRFPDYPNQSCDRKTNIPVTILGNPDAQAVEDKVLQNEEEHVSDIEQACTAMNTRLTNIQQQRGNGNSEATCKTDLLSKIGQDPARAIANAFVTRIRTDIQRRDARSHTLNATRNIVSGCSRLEFTYTA
jgi:hypothetical protein